MNRKIKEQVVEQECVLQEETSQGKKFDQGPFLIDYKNTSKIFSERSPKLSDIKVNNYLCYQQGQTLFKVTEILYEDKVIRIEDRFEVAANPNSLGFGVSQVYEKTEGRQKNCSRNIQKVRLFFKNSSKMPTAEKKDKKNIVKNIMKMFVSWLEKNSQSGNQRQALDELCQILKTQNYNNRLVKKIATNWHTNKEFLKFIVESAEDEIKYSRIQDKESHYEALQIYKELLSNNGVGNQMQSSSPASSSEHWSSEQSIHDNGLKGHNISQHTYAESGASSSKEPLVVPRVGSPDDARRNKIILVQNGVQFSK